MQILFSMIVLVSSGCHNRISHIFISHSSGEEGSPRSGCWLIWSGVRDCFLNHRWLSSLSYGREKERERGEGELFWSFLIRSLISFMGLPRWHSDKESTYQCRRCRFNPWVGKIPWKRKWQPIPVFLPGKIPRTEKPGGLQNTGSQKVGQDLATEH